MSKRARIIISRERLEEILDLPKGVIVVGSGRTPDDLNRDTFSFFIFGTEDGVPLPNAGECEDSMIVSVEDINSGVWWGQS